MQGGGVNTYNNDMSRYVLRVTRLTKVGTSLGIIIPREIAKTYNWQRGDDLIYVFASDDTLSIRKLNDKEIRALQERDKVINIDD